MLSLFFIFYWRNDFMNRLIKTYETVSSVQETLYRKGMTTPDQEIDETYHLLRDFGINIRKSDIPRNITIFDLHLWRRAKIKAHLQN